MRLRSLSSLAADACIFTKHTCLLPKQLRRRRSIPALSVWSSHIVTLPGILFFSGLVSAGDR